MKSSEPNLCQDCFHYEKSIMKEPCKTCHIDTIGVPNWTKIEVLEQARLIGMYSERELSLFAKIEQLENALRSGSRHWIQSKGQHPSPCARFCESNAFEIEIRRLKFEIEKLKNGNKHNSKFTHQRKFTRATCIQYNGENKDEIVEILGEDNACFRFGYIIYRYPDDQYNTLSLTHLGKGDWVRIGETGEIKIKTDEEMKRDYEVI